MSQNGLSFKFNHFDFIYSQSFHKKCQVCNILFSQPNLNCLHFYFFEGLKIEYLWPIIVSSFWGPMLLHFKKSNEILETWSPHCKNLAFKDPPSLNFHNRTDAKCPNPDNSPCTFIFRTIHSGIDVGQEINLRLGKFDKILWS